MPKRKKKEEIKGLRESLILGIIMSSLFLILILVTLFIGWRYSESQKLTNNWPSITAEVLSSKIDTHITASGRDAETVHELIISYRYYVNSNKYVSSNYNLEGTLKSESYNLLESAMEEFPVGSHVEAFYNPNNPNISILNKVIPNSRKLATLYKVLAFLIVFFLVSVLIVFINIRGLRGK